jgi:hypothetical protein
MGRTACTEPQCLYKGALYLYLTVELYLYSPYGPYGLYSASVPAQGCILPTPFRHTKCDNYIRATWVYGMQVGAIFKPPVLSNVFGTLNDQDVDGSLI